MLVLSPIYDCFCIVSETPGECYPRDTTVFILSVKRQVSATPEIRLGDTLQCGVVFSKPADRVAQTVIVFFAVNSVILHHCRLQADFGGLYPTVAFSSSGGSVEVKPGKTLLPVPDAISSIWMREKSSDSLDLNGISTFSLHDGRKLSNPAAVEAVLPPPAISSVIKVYASHAFTDRERVDNIMKQLQKSQPYVAVETSTSQASMEDKNQALSAAELVVLFVSNSYYNSHEMHTEYTSVIQKKEIPALICALDNNVWPPHAYFAQLQEEFSKLPWVELTLTENGQPTIVPLERYIEKKLKEQMMLEAGEDFQLYHTSVKTAHPKVSGKTSKTCIVL